VGWILARLGLALELSLLWRCVSWRAWRYYPLYFAYLVLVVARSLSIEYQQALQPLSASAYAQWYWLTDLLVVVMWFPVALEIMSHCFPRGTLLQVSRTLLLATLASLAALYLFGSGLPGGTRIPDMEQKAALAITLWVVGILLLAAYYGIILSRNTWGIAMGLGIFAAGTVMSFSALGLDGRFFTALRWARPVSFVGVLMLWNWTLWSYANPPRHNGPPDETLSLILLTFWSNMMASIRRALGL